MCISASRVRLGVAYPEGEKLNRSFQLSFNASLKFDFLGSRIISDDGLIYVRELQERFVLREPIKKTG
jgi:hypothetical protein